jgi:hippurate hydrolase
VPPTETAVLTVGSIQAGTKSNVIPDSAQLRLNLRSYSDATRTTMLDAIRRIVTAECHVSGSPQDPEFDLFDRFPLTDNDTATTNRVAEAFADFFADRAGPIPKQSASEDFSDIPDALGVPYTYWCIGGTDPDTYHHAERAGRVAQDIRSTTPPPSPPSSSPPWTPAPRRWSSPPSPGSPANRRRHPAGRCLRPRTRGVSVRPSRSADRPS